MENSELDKRSYLIGYWDGQEEIPSRVKETCKCHIEKAEAYEKTLIRSTEAWNSMCEKCRQNIHGHFFKDSELIPACKCDCHKETKDEKLGTF